ncbi:MAG: hypothetical protein OEZ58_23740, partial [Gammaproteobacteria bacterium]|nr:hypothetical protein [Gammaproteobacteria bacterium]
SIEIDEQSWNKGLLCNSLSANRPTVDECIEIYESHMNAQYTLAQEKQADEKGIQTWLESEQIVQLLAMADSENDTGNLKYQNLKKFRAIKTDKNILAAYVNLQSGKVSNSDSWLSQTIAKLVEAHHSNYDEQLRGKNLLALWQSIEDKALKESAYYEIVTAWDDKGWWKNPSSKRQRKNRDVYITEMQQLMGETWQASL